MKVMNMGVISTLEVVFAYLLMMVLTKMGDLMGVHVRTLQLCFVYDLEDLALGFHITEILL